MPKFAIPLTAGVIALILAAGAWLMLASPKQHSSPAMYNIAGADIGGPFELTDHRGQRVTSETLLDRPSLIYFGYTFCPDVCPIDTQIMTDVVDLLEARSIDLKPVFITIDPARDTVDELAVYAEAMHPKLVALTGTEAEIRAAADAYKVFYSKQEVEGSAAEYLMNHSAQTYLVLPGEGLAAVFRRDFPAEQIASDIEKILGNP